MTRLTLRIDFKTGGQLGPGKVRLLEEIDRTGSISAAARNLGMSYRRAWVLVDEVNRTFKAPAVETQPGGSGGGGTALTAWGRVLVAHYREAEARMAAGMADAVRAMEAELAAPADAAPLPEQHP